MSQANLFQFFKPTKSPAASPVPQKAAVKRALRDLVKCRDDLLDDDEEIEDKKPNKIKKSTIISTNNPSKTKTNALPPSTVSKSTSFDVDEIDLPKWLTTNLRDANQRRPTDPNYDPTTVFIPPQDEAKFTNFMQQFWAIKRNNFDSVVFIRQGKFFATFSIDAVWASSHLKIKLTHSGKELMAGVPQMAFRDWAIKIINLGKRVCKVDQVESQIDSRNRGSTIVKRDLVQAYTVATVDDFEMLESADSIYLMSVRSVLSENTPSNFGKCGVCVVDCATGNFEIGVGDLADLILRYAPREIIYKQESTSVHDINTLKALAGGNLTRIHSGDEWWDNTLAISCIQREANWDSSDLPPIFSELLSDKNDQNSDSGNQATQNQNTQNQNTQNQNTQNQNTQNQNSREINCAAVAAMGGAVYYLKSGKIAQSLLSLRRVHGLEGGKQWLRLDSSALTNLQIIPSSNNPKEIASSLLGVLDHCATGFGKRLLRRWVTHPLRQKDAIMQRQECIRELCEADWAWLAGKLTKIPDLERMLARVYANRSTPKQFVDVLAGLNLLFTISNKVCEQVSEIVEKDPQFENGLKVVFASKVEVNFLVELKAFEEKLDKEESLEAEEFVLRPDAYPDLPDTDEIVEEIKEKLHHEMEKAIQDFKTRSVKYAHPQSDRYVFEVPADSANGNPPEKYVIHSQTSKVKRYTTQKTQDLVKRLEEAELNRGKQRKTLQDRFIHDFSSHGRTWDSLVDAVASLDCLLSFAVSSNRWDSPSCFPTFLDQNSVEDENGYCQRLKLKGMRHPCIENCIPNDVEMGEKGVLLITGPNSSGKSTYARMCCSAIVLAQLGCKLPAEEAEMTPFDQIFTRIGANDRLFSGQSTFGVELGETGKIMKEATKRSFVVLDELGRGTSTFDGIAIATSVLEYFIQVIKCPVVFCTHYHVLAQQFGRDPWNQTVVNGSMAYKIGGKRLTLLYKLINGACDSSFGCAVAEMCGLPSEITSEAQKVADEFERKHRVLQLSCENGNERKVEIIEEDPALAELERRIKEALKTGTDIQKFTKLVAMLEDLPNLH